MPTRTLLVRDIVGCSRLATTTAALKPAECGRAQVQDQLAFGELHELLSPNERESFAAALSAALGEARRGPTV